MRLGAVAQAAGNRDFLARCGVTRPDDGAVVDGIANDDIQPGFGCGCPHTTGPTHVQVLLGYLGAPENMFLGRHALNSV